MNTEQSSMAPMIPTTATGLEPALPNRIPLESQSLIRVAQGNTYPVREKLRAAGGSYEPSVGWWFKSDPLVDIPGISIEPKWPRSIRELMAVVRSDLEEGEYRSDYYMRRFEEIIKASEFPLLYVFSDEIERIMEILGFPDRDWRKIRRADWDKKNPRPVW